MQRTMLAFMAVGVIALWLVLRAQAQTEAAKGREAAALARAHDALVREALADLQAPATRADATLAILSALQINRAPDRDALIAVAYENRQEAEELVLKTEQPVVRSAFSADGKRVALADHWNLYVFDLETGAELHRVAMHPLAMTYTNEALVLVTRDGIEVRSLDGKTLDVLTPFTSELRGDEAVITPDAHLVVTRTDIWRRESERYVPTHRREDAFSMQVSADGTSMAGVGKDDRILFFDVASQRKLATASEVRVAYEGQWSPDKDRYVLWAYGDAAIVDLPSGKLRHLLRSDHETLTDVRFSLDGAHVFIATPRAIYDVDSALGELRSQYSFLEHSTAIAISPDQRRFARATAKGHRVELADFDRPEHFRDLGGHDAEITSLSFSRFGPHLLSTTKEGTSTVWRLDRHGLVTPLTFAASQPRAARWNTNDRAHAVIDVGNEGGVYVWNAKGERQTLIASEGTRFKEATVWPKTIFIADQLGGLGVWDPSTLKRKVALSEVCETSLRLALDAPRAVCCRRNGCEEVNERGEATKFPSPDAGLPASSDERPKWPAWSKHVRGLPLERGEIAIAPDGNHALVVDEATNYGAIFDLSNESLLRVICAVAKKRPQAAASRIVTDICP